jgi:alkyl hydroperoxide reductase subunit AhpC
MLSIGKQAPDFNLKGVWQGTASSYSIQDYRGKWLILFFYPADFTFICPTEVSGFSIWREYFALRRRKLLARSGLQFFSIAVGAALLGYGIGLAVQHFFPDIPVAS